MFLNILCFVLTVETTVLDHIKLLFFLLLQNFLFNARHKRVIPCLFSYLNTHFQEDSGEVLQVHTLDFLILL